MLGQTNTSGGNTSDLETRVSSLEVSVVDLDRRVEILEETTKKYYVNIKPLPTLDVGSGGTHFFQLRTSDDTYALTPSRYSSEVQQFLYSININGSTYLQYTFNNSTGVSVTPSGAVESTQLLEANTPISITFSGTVVYGSSQRIGAINIYEYGVKKYSKSTTSSSTEQSFSYTSNILLSKNTRIFRDVASSGSYGFTYNVYIEEYTP